MPISAINFYNISRHIFMLSWTTFYLKTLVGYRPNSISSALSREFPVSGWYFLLLIVLIALALLTTVIIVNVHNRGETGRPIPSWIRCLTGKKNGDESRIQGIPFRQTNGTPAGHREKNLTLKPKV